MFKNKKTFAVVLLLVVAVFFVSAGIATAQQLKPTDEGFQLVPCDGTPQSPCDYNAFIKGVRTLINFFIAFAIPVSALAFAWAGFKYLTAGGDSGEVKKAHEIFKKVMVGFIMVLAGWLIVQTITSVFLEPGFDNILEQ